MKSTKCGSLQKPYLSCLMHWSLVDLEESHRGHPNPTATDPKRWKEDWDAFVSSAFGLDPIFFAASAREEPLERRHTRQRTRKCNMWQEGLSFAFGENVAIANIPRAKTNAKSPMSSIMQKESESLRQISQQERRDMIMQHHDTFHCITVKYTVYHSKTKLQRIWGTTPK